ncbi:MAG: hypothetical protein J6H18_02745 [Lachnospiraceae bacterium]|nr:hypothetical protein [Lachnospiraceae bacterium]
MRKYNKTRVGLALILCAAMLLLSACSAQLEKDLREKARGYIETLPEKTGIQDRLELRPEKADMSSKVDPIAFVVRSNTFQGDFTVFVTRDGKGITDSYYTLSLARQADQEIKELFREVMGEEHPAVEADFQLVAREAYSGKSFATLKAFCEAEEGQVSPLIIRIRDQGRIQLSQEEVDQLLMAFQERGLSGSFYPYASDSVWFEVGKNTIWQLRRTGADGGALMVRNVYVPTAFK